MAKAEGLNLHALLVDSPPELQIENGSMGMHALRQTCETFSYAMAMVGLAHLATMKHYYLRFINLMTTKMDSGYGNRITQSHHPRSPECRQDVDDHCM